MAVIPDPNVYDIGVREGVGPLENGDLVVLVLDDAYVYDPEDATVADLVGNEVSGGAYARETITATVDRIGDVWLALPDSTPSFDLTGITRGGFVVARDGATDADRKLVRWFPDPAGPEVSAEPSWPDGILQARIDTGEAAGGGVQSVTGTAVDDTDPANPVIDLSGVQTIVAGTGITVDDTDPAHPIISATGGGGGGGGAVGSQVFDVSSETGSFVSVDLTTMPVDKQTAVVLAPPQQHQLSFDWPDMSARGVLIVVCMPSSGAGMGATTPQIPDANNQVAVIMAFEGDGSPEAVWLNSMPNGYWEPDGQVLGTVSGMPRWVTP